MQIREKDKQLIGKMLKVHRLAYQHTREGMYFNHGVAICSNSTYEKIERGEIVKQDEIYVDLINNSNLRYQHNPMMQSLIRDLCNELYHSFYFLNLEEINALRRKLDDYEELFLSSFTYEYYYVILKAVIDNFFGESFKQQDYNLLINMLNQGIDFYDAQHILVEIIILVAIEKKRYSFDKLDFKNINLDTNIVTYYKAVYEL